MIAFGIVLIVIGVFFGVVATLLLLGKVNLINYDHQSNIKDEDKIAFARMIGLSLLFSVAGFIVTGIISLVFQENIALFVPVITTLVPIFVSIVFMFLVIKKFNGAIFG